MSEIYGKNKIGSDFKFIENIRKPGTFSAMK